MGLATSNMANMAKSGVLSQNENFKVAQGGVREANFFLLEIQLLRYLGDPFAKKKNFGDPPCALQHYSTQKRPLKKWTPTSKIFAFWGFSASGAFPVSRCASVCVVCRHAFLP